MIRKISLLAAFGAGYVLGAKAGTGRYDQIASAAGKVAARPEVQQAKGKAVGTAKDAASDLVDTAKAKVVGASETVQDTAEVVAAEARAIKADATTTPATPTSTGDQP